MNPDRDEHQRARELIAQAGTAGPSDEQARLASHLRNCADCRDYEEAAGSVIRALRLTPLSINASLVRTAQRRVRLRALERQHRQERIYLVSLSCLLVGLLAAFTTPLLCQIFRWTGSWAGAPNWVWQAAFAFASIVPALLTSAVLLTQGTHLTTRVGRGYANEK